MDFKLLEIAIGLIFVYLLLSIFAMVIMEVISTLFRMRGELLKDSINKLLFDAKNNKVQVNNFYQLPLMKFLGDNVTSWLWLDKLVGNGSGKLPSYIKTEDFYDNLITYVNNNQFSNDLQHLQNLISKNSMNLSEDAKKHLTFLIHKSDNNISEFKKNVERWFNESMDRANTWYSRQVQYILLAVGLVISFAVNADTIDIFKKLNDDPKLRLEMVKSAEQYLKDHKELPNTTSLNEMEKIQKSVEIEYKDLQKNSQGILIWEKGEIGKLDFLAWMLKICGFLITATAISLGSNFWFDMLKKVINIRTLGKPTNK